MEVGIGTREGFSKRLIYHLHAMPYVWRLSGPMCVCVCPGAAGACLRQRRLPLLHLNGRKAFGTAIGDRVGEERRGGPTLNAA